MKDVFKNKVSLITGGSGGFGRAVAKKLAEYGANVVIVDIDEESSRETIELLEEYDVDTLFVKADVSSVSDVKNYVKETIDQFGQIDFFFNNAGTLEPTKVLTEQTDEQIDMTIDVNLKGVIYGTKYVLSEMEKTGGGVIVNTSSGAGLAGNHGMSMYSASKHGVIGLTKSVALEYANKDIRINAIAPGSADTTIIEGIDSEVQEEIEASIPMERLGKAEEIADAVIYLFSDKASYINGVVLPVDGGISA